MHSNKYHPSELFAAVMDIFTPSPRFPPAVPVLQDLRYSIARAYYETFVANTPSGGGSDDRLYYPLPVFRCILRSPITSCLSEFTASGCSTHILQIFGIMSVALKNGWKEAYHIFMEDDWMTALSELWVATAASDEDHEIGKLIGIFLWHLLSDPKPASLEILVGPLQLMFPFLALDASRPYAWKTLLNVRSDHPSWTECHQKLKDLLTWCHDQVGVFP